MIGFCNRNGALLLEEEIIVGIGDIKCGKGGQSIATYALGSCVGVCMYDELTGIGGLLHALLPFAKNIDMVDPARYVDTGVKRLFHEICHRGASPARLKAKVVGGAKMFEFQTNVEMEDIGTANVHQVHRELQALGIPIVGEVTGGEVGRTIHFTPGTGSIRIHASDKSEKII
ncbi:MAG: chemotaxis protein CheD [Lachnospiraceae bacterium]|nr:chemotaxis protein CheD [Lachnospiraceae bacterium]